MRTSVIPFGPQHPVLPEPLQLKLTVEDEVITEAVPALGYVHRGLEALAQNRDFHQMVQVTERVCGICSVLHAICYCQGLEDIMGITVPPRARYLRVIWGELLRLHSHLLWMGLFADSFGFESLFMQLWKIRERVLDIQEATTGNRVISGTIRVGGVSRDMDARQVHWIADQLTWVAHQVRQIEPVLREDFTIRRRTEGKGVLTSAQARELGAVGPVLRASGIAQDIRQTGYAAYGELDFEPVTATAGDCHARCMVRLGEIDQSIDLIHQALDRLPGGDIRSEVRGRPQGETLMRVEQPRGEVVYYIRADGGKTLSRVRIRTPTFANIPVLVKLLPGIFLSDVPVVVLSIDPCVSCLER
ncbi:MAG: nickel-dependent hydrogenase large subunit [Deltaproteobacteria bacterium]|nr:nickel-dependent hydrogenase large subunit [Deltaproteobacteria bacterium]